MDIRELLEQRKRELYGETSSDSEVTLENFGDVSDEMGTEIEDLGDLTVDDETETSMESSEYFTDTELRDIEIEASQIEDPDAYISQVIEESTTDILEFVGESYINDLILEDALFDCETAEDLEVIEESVKEKAVNFKSSAISKVKGLWAKFKAWVKNLYQVIKNQFTSGENLVKKYKGQILSEYKKRGSKIKVKTYNYKFNTSSIQTAVSSLEVAFEELVGKNKKLYKEETSKTFAANSGAKSTKGKDLRAYAAKCVRDGEKKEYTLSQLDINSIIDIAGNAKSAIKPLKEFQKAEEDFFKQRINEIKNTDFSVKVYEGKPYIAGETKTKDEGKAIISSQVSAAKRGMSIGSTLIKSYISELKSANRACLAIVRKLLNQSSTGGTTETKLHKKLNKEQ